MLRLVLITLIAHYASAQTNKCCPDLGCFDASDPFDHLPLPDCPEEFEMDIRMYTQTSPEVGQEVDRVTVPPIFSATRNTVVVTHGWLGSDNHGYLNRWKDDILTYGDYNVIILGWQGSAQQLWYPQSASDTRTVGAHISAIISNLVTQTGASFSSFHCVGHSLGAHVCGHLGQTTKIGRITGLDPAGPLFEDKALSVGLNPSAADFVDVSHTHGERNFILNLGTMRRLGHADFYPDGGVQQPGCIFDSKDTPAQYPEYPDFSGKDIDLTPACSHLRAVEYFETSILNDCFKVRYNCTDQHSLPNSCWEWFEPIQSMGFHADTFSQKEGIFYMPLNADEPYCEY